MALKRSRNPEVTGGKQARTYGRPTAGPNVGNRFQAGQSGNPAGRPAGSRNRVTVLCEQLLAADAAGILDAAILRAKAGDGVAMKLCIDRLIPIRGARDRAIEIDVGVTAKAGDLAAAAAAVIAQAAAGEITLSEAKEFMALLEGQRKILETTDLVVRLQLLEGRVGEGGGAAADGLVDPDVAARVRRVIRKGFDDDF